MWDALCLGVCESRNVFPPKKEIKKIRLEGPNTSIAKTQRTECWGSYCKIKKNLLSQQVAPLCHTRTLTQDAFIQKCPEMT